MSAGQTTEREMVVKVPYGSGVVKTESSSFNNVDEYTYYFQNILMPGPEGDAPDSYVYPKREMTPDDAKRNIRVLTESPVVYIVVFAQSETMKRDGWLKSAVGDFGEERFGLYKRDYVVYVGETNNIINRTNQHLTASHRLGGLGGEEAYDDLKAELDERTQADRVIQKAVEDGVEVNQYIIWDTYFTKSMTLDMENKYIDYAHSLDNVYTLNGRGNAQRSYYKSEEKDAVCSRIWQMLSLDDPVLFPPEHDIWNSELYKVSPFHALGKEQSDAVNSICDSALSLLRGEPVCGEELAETTSQHRLIVVEGASGTGKSIVLSTLFVRLSEALRDSEEADAEFGLRPNSRVCLVVNQDQQLTMYTNLAKKIGLMRTNDKSETCVFKATPFLNAVDSGKREAPDIVLVDEAHLLRTTPHRSYGKKFHGNQLYDILLRAKVVVAVFDPVQVMRSSQHWDRDLVEQMLPPDSPVEGGILHYTGPVEMKNRGNSVSGRDTFNAYRISLTEQFRIDASDGVMEWIDRLADTTAVGMAPIPEDTTPRNPPMGVHGEAPYDIRVYTSPVLLAKAIRRRSNEIKSKIDQSRTTSGGARFASPLCRLLATYDWAYDTGEQDGSVDLYRIPSKTGDVWEMPVDGKAPEGFSGSPNDCFSRKWNYSVSGSGSDAVWSSDPNADEEVGSYFSVQGFDLNYAGVIIGPSIRYQDGKIVVDPSASKDGEVSGEFAEELILQQLKVLLRRGIHGLYLFAVDPGLQNALVESARSSGRLDIED